MSATNLVSVLLFSAALASAHDAPGSSDFDLKVPNFPLGGAITFVTLIGPAAGEQVLHTTWNLTYTAPPGGTPASEVVLELTLPLATGLTEWAVHGSDFGWPASTGTFSGTLNSDQLNGVLTGPFSFTAPELVILSTGGGVHGQFTASTITLELAGSCQTDLGFSGPGAVTLSVCGDALATGGLAEVSVSGAPPFAPIYLVAGLSLAPTPFKGGTLVPVPILVLVPTVADATGQVALHLPGGGGPLTAYVQAVAVDPSQSQGFAISNAVELQLEP